MSGVHPFIEPFLERLHGRGRLRVLSIVVSIFGDLVQPRHRPVSMQELAALTGAIGIESGALRTAMSRLAKDSWVERHKEGRNSFYSLSAGGEEAVLLAAERIYGPLFSAATAGWKLAIYPDIAPEPEGDISDHLSLGKQIQLFSNTGCDGLADENALVLDVHPHTIPDWVFEHLNLQSHAEEYSDLWSLLEPVQDARRAIIDMAPLDAILLRVLLIHFWRRLILRHPLLPHGLVEKDWPGQRCHAALMDLYPQLVDRSEHWWDMPTEPAGLEQLGMRFRPPSG